MNITPDLVLYLMAGFITKHVIADYFLQTGWMLAGRDVYLHIGRLAHAGMHAIGTGLVLGIAGTPVGLMAVLSLVDLVIHFHVDWAKARYSEHKGATPYEAAYWRAMGTDQAAHLFTYVGLVWVWIRMI